MQIMTLALFLMLSVLISAVIDRFIKNLTIPLVQIGLGLLIALFAQNAVNIELDSELFMVLFIAPLLYIEAKHASKLELWKERKGVLGLAIGLVILTAIVIGFALHWLVPMVPLFTALALGAALGPTDAVAVTSVSRTTNIPKRIFSLLKGELLLNDASGIVMFQVAIAAAAVGKVSLVHVGVDFVIEFFGGLLVGVLLGFGCKIFLRKMRESGLDSTVFHVLFEICMPFLVYLLADSIHCSGVIAVVACGLVDPIQNIKGTPSASKMNIVSESVWEVLSFMLNGIVFVLLGTQIPEAMVYAWDDASISNVFLLACIVLVTFILLFTRFIWAWFMMRDKDMGDDEKPIPRIKRALILTLCGAKGTITLSILFTLPYVLSDGRLVSERSLLIFIGCGVIVVTLLLATFVLPLLAPVEKVEEDEEAERINYYSNLQYVLREVIYQLTASETDLNRASTRAVVEDYQDRLEFAKSFTDDGDSAYISLRLQVIRWEELKILEMLDAGEVSEDAADTLFDALEKTEKILSSSQNVIVPKEKVVRARNAFRRIRRLIAKIFDAKIAKAPVMESNSEVKLLRIAVERYVVDRLKTEMELGTVYPEDAAKIVVDYERSLASLTRPAPTVTTAIINASDVEDVREVAFLIELNKIDELQEIGRLSRKNAQKMRDNVTLMQLEQTGAI